MTRKLCAVVFAAAVVPAALTAAVKVENVTVSQTRKAHQFAVDYTLSGTGGGAFYIRAEAATNGVPLALGTMRTVTGDYSADTDATVSGDGRKRFVWQVHKDLPEGTTFENLTFTVRAYAAADVANVPWVYVVVDLSNGAAAATYPVRYTFKEPDMTDVTGAACKTTELWLRRCPAGRFVRGYSRRLHGSVKPNTAYFLPHTVEITRPFFLGVFEVTQRQYELVMGTNTSAYTEFPACPVEQMSFTDIRGATVYGPWPENSDVGTKNSFFGRLRTRTGGALCFDLPTQAQWEYACLAGAVGELSSGLNLSNGTECPNLSAVGRYSSNRNDGKFGVKTAVVGQYKPNNWGLYDMHGNVWEAVLDWRADVGKIPPVLRGPRGWDGPGENDDLRDMVNKSRARCGGGYSSDASKCSAQNWGSFGAQHYAGFRVALQAEFK